MKGASDFLKQLRQKIGTHNSWIAGTNKKDEIAGIPGAPKRGRPKGPSAVRKQQKAEEMGEDDANPSGSDANGEYEDNALAGRMNDDSDAEQV